MPPRPPDHPANQQQIILLPRNDERPVGDESTDPRPQPSVYERPSGWWRLSGAKYGVVSWLDGERHQMWSVRGWFRAYRLAHQIERAYLERGDAISGFELGIFDRGDRMLWYRKTEL